MKKIWVILLSIFIILGLGGTLTKNENTTLAATKTNKKTSSYKFYKDAKKNSRIYYKLDLNKKSFGRESIIDSIFYINKGKYTYYEVSNLEIEHTLEDLKGLSDKEVLKKAVTWNKELAENYVEQGKKEANERIESENLTQGQDYESIIDIQNKNLELFNEYKYEKPKALSLEIKAEADPSGNNLEKEYLVLPSHNFKIKNYVIDGWTSTDGNTPVKQYYYPKSNIYRVSIGPTQQTSKVYDKTYAYGSFGKDYVLATKGNQLMELDKLNEKGLLDLNVNTKHYDTEKDMEGNSYMTWTD